MKKAPARPAQPALSRGGLVGRSLARGLGVAARPRASGAVAYLFDRFSWFVIVVVIACHMVLGRDEFPLVARAVLALPAVIFVIEARAYLKNTADELPFIVFSVLQFYVSYGFPTLHNAAFFDMNGPVTFPEQTYVAGSLAVVLGTLGLWGGTRVGARFGHQLRRVAPKALPPDTMPTRWDDAFFAYAGLSVVVNLLLTFAPSVIPGQLGVAVAYIFQIEFALGLALVRPPRSLGPRMSQALLTFSLAIGLLRGQVDPMVRSVMAFIAARWITVRRVPVAIMAAMLGIFLIVQPAKQNYREQVWGRTARTGESVGFVDRVVAWEDAFGSFFSTETRKKSEENASAFDRLVELNPVLYALEVVPSRVPYLYGESFLEVVYSPIPRLIWPNKPTTIERSAQRWAVLFGLQTERGSKTTAVGLNLFVEGYWNFGWFGLVLFCFLAGLISGGSQTLFAGKHWALRTTGIAQVAMVTAMGAVVSTYSQLFQMLVARLITVWGIYWVAQQLSDRARSAPGARAHHLARR